MNPLAFATYSTAITTFLIGLFVYLKNRRSALNRIFFFYSSAIAVWALFSASHTIATDQGISLFYAKISHLAVPLIPVLFFHFVLIFFEQEKIQKRRWLLFSIYGIAFLIAGITFMTDLVIRGVRSKLDFPYFMDAGPLYFVVIAFFSALAFAGLMFIYTAIFKSSGRRKTQLLYLFWGSLVGYIFGSSNFFPVYNLDYFPYPYGSFGITFYVFIMAYAIVKHQLLEIEFIVRRTIVFAGLLAFVFGVFALATFLVQEVLSLYGGITHAWNYAIGIFLIVLGFDPIRNLLVNLTDQYLFQKKFDYRKLLKDASMGLARINSLTHQLRLISHFLTMRARIKSVAIYMSEKEERDFLLREHRFFGGSAPVILRVPHDSQILFFLRKERREAYLLINEIEELVNQPAKNGTVDSEYNYVRLREEMRRFNASLVVASFYQDHLIGILMLGEKKSEEMYTEADIHVFTAIAQESALAMENARLFDEKVERSLELEALNQELKQSNERLKETQASLIVAEKNATMVGMAKAIGHEVYNPLCTVEGRAVLLEKKMKRLLPEFLRFVERTAGEAEIKASRDAYGEMIDYVNRIERSAERIKVAVQTLTNILKESKGEMTALNFLVLWKESVEATRFSTYDENLSVCEFKESIKANLVVHGNLQQLIQVFTNLIKNAYEAMLGVRERWIQVKADVDPENPKWARIEVADNGPGIPIDIQRKIFQQGFSTKQAKEKSIGTAGQGQGLYVCKHIIESVHKGEISVEGEPGHGATFIIKLPLATEQITSGVGKTGSVSGRP